ncbi:MAG: hypothetical protein R3F49_22765 [Planctomycetota bacterium]
MSSSSHSHTDPHAHPAGHEDREIEEDVLAVPFIAWLGVTGAILIVASVLALTGMYYQTEHALERERYLAADAQITPSEARLTADHETINGYFKGIPSPDGVVEEGPDAKKFVSIPVAEGRKKVLETYRK